MTLTILDTSVAAIIVLIASLVLFSRNILQSIIYFITLGLLVSLAWVRLNAPDIAIAEAAIGAGLTGALFLITWKRLNRKINRPFIFNSASTYIAIAASILSVILVAILSIAIFISKRSDGLTAEITNSLSLSGVSNPVTAVLLNFRSIDTLLEIGVLFLTLIAIRALTIEQLHGQEELSKSVFLHDLLHLVVPTSVIVGAYLLWIGSTQPGGAFQAGAIWAGALVLLKLANSSIVNRFQVDWLLSLGLSVFVGAAAASYFITGNILAYPSDQAAIWILLIEFAAAISIALILFELFCVNRSITSNTTAYKLATKPLTLKSSSKR